MKIVREIEEHWSNELIKKYPKLLSEVDSFSCGKGWENILSTMLEAIDWHLKIVTYEQDEMHIIQIKQKLGSLRVYTSHEIPFVSGAIAMAESMSQVTCEHCGSNGKIRSGGLSRTLCDYCYDLDLKR